MKFTAAGDALIQQHIPKEYDGFKEIRDYISKGDARFFNLETTLHNVGECFASQFSGGTYLRTDPKALDGLLDYGFNMVSFNNNHAMDFSYDGFLKTLEQVEKSGLVQSGAGRDLSEASAPAFLDTKNGRVALISVNATFDPSMMAGLKSKDFPGRPGINGLRHSKTLVVTESDFNTMKRIALESEINAEALGDIAGGYNPPWPDGVYYMGDLPLTPGEKTALVTHVNETDMQRVEKAIETAKLTADYIIVSFHTHEMSGDTLENVPEFISEFCHRAIDCGAHAIIGHGPHLLRGVEIYKDRPIFHSLGDFILQLYSVEAAPEDFYQKYGLTSEAGIYTLLKTRSKNFKIGLMEKPIMQEAVIPYWEMEDGKLTKLELLPITCYKSEDKSVTGLPKVASGTDIPERLAKLSEPYGVKMEFVDGIIRCNW